MTMFTMSPAEVREGIIDCFAANLVPFVTSSPGLGKSSLFKQVAKDFNLKFIDLRLSQCAPEDLMGLPMREEVVVGFDGDGIPVTQLRASFVPFSTFPLEGDPLPLWPGETERKFNAQGECINCYAGFLLLLDEFNSATKLVQAAAYRPVLDHEIGQAKLHENCFIGCAGNLATDRAIVNSLSTAMQSRVIHMEMEISHKDFMDHAVANGFDARVLAFLEFKPKLLHAFKPDHQDKTFPCSRTWEFASRLITGKPNDKVNRKLLAGTIGEGAAVEFTTFLKVYDQVPSYHKIVSDPKGTVMPTDPGTIYAVVSMLIEKFTKASFEGAVDYAKRLPAEFQVIYCRGVKRKDPTFLRDPKYVELRKSLARFMLDDDDPMAIAA